MVGATTVAPQTLLAVILSDAAIASVSPLLKTHCHYYHHIHVRVGSELLSDKHGVGMFTSTSFPLPPVASEAKKKFQLYRAFFTIMDSYLPFLLIQLHDKCCLHVFFINANVVQLI